MRIITLTQPWASAVAWGLKRIETRSWWTSYRGPLAIHAAQSLDPAGGEAGLLRLCTEIEALRLEMLRRRMVIGGVLNVSALPRGQVVAVSDLKMCERTEDLVAVRDVFSPAWREVLAPWPMTPAERSLGNYGPERFGWLLADVQELLFPITYRGGQGLRRVSDEQAETFRRYTRPAGHYPMEAQNIARRSIPNIPHLDKRCARVYTEEDRRIGRIAERSGAMARERGDREERPEEPQRPTDFRLTYIPNGAELAHTDLRLVYATEAEAGNQPEAFLVELIPPSGVRCEAVYVHETQRLGVAWGGPATWATVEGAAAGLRMWLTDSDAWEAAN